MQSITDLGWNQEFTRAWKTLNLPNCIPGRVIADFGAVLRVAIPEEKKAEISGRLQHFSELSALPKVGDWVAVQPAKEGSMVIEAVVPRKNEISRRKVGKKVTKQVLAANIDVAFIVQSLDNDFSIERLQRYLFQLHQNTIAPILVLNKLDKIADATPFTAQVRHLSIPVVACSAQTGAGINDLLTYLKPGSTAVLLGSSGVGKSTLINCLLGQNIQKTQEVRSTDGTGQHTTTHRELFVLSNGSLLIDTPGIRELQLWGTEEDLLESFEDIVQIAHTCQFRTCQHGQEAGCQIRTALQKGIITAHRYQNYLKLKREIAHLDSQPAAEDRKKPIGRQSKSHYRMVRDAESDEIM